jgi:hypothetical protein
LTSAGKSFYLQDVLPLPYGTVGHDVRYAWAAWRVPAATELSEGDPMIRYEFAIIGCADMADQRAWPEEFQARQPNLSTHYESPG